MIQCRALRVAALISLTGLMLATRVYSQAKAARGAALNWVRLPGAEACITSLELAQRVETRLGRSVFVPDAQAALAVEGHVSVQPGGGYNAHLTLVDHTRTRLGERVLETRASDCRTLDAAVVLVVALTLLPSPELGPGIPLPPATEQLLREIFQAEPSLADADLLRSQSAAQAEPARPLANAPSSPAFDAKVATDKRTNPDLKPLLPRMAAGAALLMSLGYLPGAMLGIELSLTVAHPALWPLRLAAAVLPSKERRLAQAAGITTRVGLRQVTLAACPWRATAGSALSVQLCPGAAAGQLLVRSRGYATGGGARADFMLDALALFEGRWQIMRHVAVGLTLLAALPFMQRRYEYRALDGERQPVFRTAQVCGHGALGVVGTF